MLFVCRCVLEFKNAVIRLTGGANDGFTRRVMVQGKLSATVVVNEYESATTVCNISEDL